jgi:DNA-binding response OmpR family regulator
LGTIVVADDEPHITQAIRAHLEGVGHNVVETHNYREVLAACREVRPDLVVLDSSMPDWEMQPTRMSHRAVERPQGNCLLSPFRRSSRFVDEPVKVYRAADMDIVRTLREQLQGTCPRLLVMHNKPAEHIEWDHESSEWSDVLMKPFMPADLLTTVERLLNVAIG